MPQPISASDLHAMMIAEFAKVRPAGCTTCVVPKPFWGPAPGTDKVYWYMETAAECPHGCRQLIAQIWAKATTDFEIDRPTRVPMHG
jgi:hypothetical protein